MPPSGNPVFASDFLTKINRKNDLLTRLNTLHNSLSELSQNEKDRPKSLRVVAGQLVSKSILGNVDREVRLLSCCCIVDILRIFAPDAPYSGEELCLAFDGIIHAIRGLSTYDPNSGIGSKIFYILNNLSTVKSCSIIVYLTDQGVEGANDRLKEFFEALISSIRTEHSDAVAGHIGSILQSLIEESESLDQELLDVLLSPLLPSAKQENPAAFNLVQSVLRRTTLAVQGPISTFVNRCLAGNMCVNEQEGGDGDTSIIRAGDPGNESDLSEHIYALIYELHKVSADILLRILPNICVQLQADESAVRLKAIRLLGRLFASPHAEYGVQFARNFRDFLGRFVDISDDVRLEMIDCGFMIICHKPLLSEVVVDHISKRLRDGSGDVRFAALGRLLDTAMEDPTHISPEVFREMGERVKDKKQQVRKVAQIGLSKVFWRHVSMPAIGFGTSDNDELLVGDSETDYEYSVAVAESMGVHPEIWRRISFVPGFIVNCWGYPDPLDKHLVIQLFQEQILPKPPKISLINQDEELKAVLEAVLSQEKSSSQSQSQDSSELSISAELGIKGLELWEHKRATLLLRIFTTLDPTQKTCLGGILAYKAKIRSELSQFVNKWVSLTTGPSKSNIAFQMSRAGFRLLQNFPSSLSNASEKRGSGNSTVNFDKLILSKDKTLLRLLKASVAALPPSKITRQSSASRQMALPDESEFCVHSVVSRACVQRDDLRRRLESKSPLGLYMQRLFDTSSVHMLANPYTVKSLLKHMAAICALGEYDDDEIRQKGRMHAMKNTSDLLIMLAKYFPIVFAGASPEIDEWLVAICEGGMTVAGQEDETEDTSSRGKKQRPSVRSKGGRSSSISSAASTRRRSGDREFNSNTARDLCKRLLEYAIHNVDPKACEILAECACSIVQGSLISMEMSESFTTASHLCDTMGVTTALNTMCRANRLTASAPLDRLACDLHVVASLLGAYGDSVRELSGSFGRLSDFLNNTIFNKKSDFHKSYGGEVAAGEGEEDAYLYVLLGALKVWSELVFKKALRESMATGVSPFHAAPGKHDDDDESIDFSARDDLPQSERFPEYTVKLVSIIFSCINSFGAKLGDIAITEKSRQVKLRETATICLIRMLKVKSIGKGINSMEWQALAWTLLDDNEECRRNILHALGVLIQTHCVHPRFLSLPCILAPDEKLYKQAEQSLLFSMKRLRCTHAELCTRVMAMNDAESEEGRQLRRIADNNSPECVVPYVIYLLSHHPDFPASIHLKSVGDEERMKKIVRSIKMVFSILLTSLGNESDNLPYLMKQVDIISRYYQDRLDHSNEALRFVTKIASSVLKTYIKTQDDIQPFAGDINLPMDLFEEARGGEYEEEDAAVSRALAAASKPEHAVHHRSRAPVGGGVVTSPSKGGVKGSVKVVGAKAVSAAATKRKVAPSKKKVSKPSKPDPPCPASSRTSSRRASAASGVSYADTRDSEDEAEMEEVEEVLSGSGSGSAVLSHQHRMLSSQGSGRLSAGAGRHSTGSSGSRQSFGSATGFSISSVESALSSPVSNKGNDATMAKKRRVSSGWAGAASWEDEDMDGSSDEANTSTTTSQVSKERPGDRGSVTTSSSSVVSHEKKGFASRRKSHGTQGVSSLKEPQLVPSTITSGSKEDKNAGAASKSRTTKKNVVLELLPTSEVTSANKKKRTSMSSVSDEENIPNKKSRVSGASSSASSLPASKKAVGKNKAVSSQSEKKKNEMESTQYKEVASSANGTVKRRGGRA